MLLAINTSLQQSQLVYSRFSVKQAAANGSASSLPSPPQDPVELSGETAPTAQGEYPAEYPHQLVIAAQQGDLSLQAGSLSIDGSISAAGGAGASFSLDMQVVHASFSSSTFCLDADANGYQSSYAGSSAELSSTSFSFSLAGEVPDGPIRGSGSGGLVNAGLKEIRHTVQPLIKDFLCDACIPSDKPNVNKLFRAIA